MGACVPASRHLPALASERGVGAGEKHSACGSTHDPAVVAGVRRWHDLIHQHKADLATLMTLECGKPTAEALAEIASGWVAHVGRLRPVTCPATCAPPRHVLATCALPPALATRHSLGRRPRRGVARCYTRPRPCVCRVASVEWFAGEAVRVCGDLLEPPSKDRRMLVLKQVGQPAAVVARYSLIE